MNRNVSLTDGLGSTSDLRDESGDAVADYTYDVFGAIRAQSGSSPNEFTFTGEQVDADSGLYFLRARYYDPATGRFVGQDPLLGSAREPSSLNRYPYVLNDPVNLVDPSGLHCRPWHPHHCVTQAVDAISSFIDFLWQKTFPLRAPVTFALEQLFRKFSGGDVTNKEGGIRLIENCTGLCGEVFSRGNARAFTLGHTIFVKGRIGSSLLKHELRHVRQYEFLGDWFLPWYFGPASAGAAISCGLTGNLSRQCLHDRNFFEFMAGPE